MVWKLGENQGEENNMQEILSIRGNTYIQVHDKRQATYGGSQLFF